MITREEIKKYQEGYRKLHKEELNRKNKLRYLTNKEKILNQKKEYYLINKIEILKQRQEYYLKNSKKIILRIKNYEKIKFQINLNFKLKKYLRSRMWHVLKKNQKSNSTMKLVGCSIEVLKQHLESQFQTGMNWDNYGLWHVDHIKPCFSFDLSKSKEQAKCFNYKNLRPLWAKENLCRGKK